MSSHIQSALKEGSVFGGILLITGSCVGAGMLALPVITGLGGFIPSSLLFLGAWAFMTTTAFLLLEVNLTVGYHLSLISIAEKTLGRFGKLLCWSLFLFLFYSINVAYISASGGILQGVCQDLFHVTLPSSLGSLVFTVFFGGVIYFGTRLVDYVNRLLMAGLVVTYVLLVTLGLNYVQPHFLLSRNFMAALGALPVMVISFGFHNMIPSLAEYFKGDRRRLRLTVLVGSLIPLLIYLLWEAVMLGIIPIEGRSGLNVALDKGEAATTALRVVVGNSWVGSCAEGFALFAIVTSFLAQSLSLVDFLADGFKCAKVGLKRVGLILMTLVPPFLFSFFKPGLFIGALTLAGGFSAVILFGVLPVIMVTVLRKKIALWQTLVLAFALGVFGLELASLLGFSLYE